MQKWTLIALLAAVALTFGAGALVAGDDCCGACKDKDKKETKDKPAPKEGGDKKTQGEAKPG